MKDQNESVLKSIETIKGDDLSKMHPSSNNNRANIEKQRRDRDDIPVPQIIGSRSETIGRSNVSTISSYHLKQPEIPYSNSSERRSIYQEIDDILKILCVSSLLVEIRAMDSREIKHRSENSHDINMDWKGKDSYQNISYPITMDLAFELIKMNKKRLQGRCKTTEKRGDGSIHGHRMDLFHTLKELKGEADAVDERRTDEGEDHRNASIFESVVDEGVEAGASAGEG